MSVTQETLDRIKDQLRQAQATGGHVQQDLYNHLTEVFNRIIMHHSGSSDAYEKFEEISALVKQTHLKFKDPLKDSEVNAAHADKALSTQGVHVAKCQSLLAGETAGPKDLLQKNKTFTLTNFAEEAEMLEWANIGFGEENTYKLQHSIKRLCIMSGADQVRFVGKIYGIDKDYWIVSGRQDDEVETGLDPQQEPRGTGVNELAYWVTDNLLNDWVQLPDAQPKQIIASRKIKHIFTGDLNAKINSNPPFPGKERHLLRSQLARIFHATTIAPNKMYEIEEEGNLMKFSEEFVMPSTEELKATDQWVNIQPLLLKCGRTTHHIPKELAEQEEEAQALKDELEKDDAPVDRLRALNEQLGVPGTGATKEEDKAWIAKLVGDTQQYNKLKADEGTTTYATLVMRSIRWPGAVTVSKNGKFTSVYVGYGLKRGDASFSPIEPPNVPEEPQDQTEQPEPTPLEEPVAKAEAIEGQEEEGEGDDDA